MEKLVSIVIPVYNVEGYVRECIESVLKQSYKSLEIFLVDDGSTDKSGLICDKYSKKDCRIKVIHKKNGGLSSARNAALDEVRGEFVYFLDSDDYISSDLIIRYMGLIEQYDADIVMGTSYEFWGKVNSNIDHFKIESNPEVFSTKEAIKHMLMDDKLQHAAAGPLFRTSLYDGIRFPLGMLYEDFATTYYVVSKARKVVYIDDKRCFYRTRPDSIMNATVTEKDMVMLDIADNVAKDMTEKYPDLRVAAIRKKLVTNLKLYSRILNVGLSAFPDAQSRIRNNVMHNYKVILKSNEVSVKDKTKVRVFFMGKIPFFIMYKLNDKVQKENKKKA